MLYIIGSLFCGFPQQNMVTNMYHVICYNNYLSASAYKLIDGLCGNYMYCCSMLLLIYRRSSVIICITDSLKVDKYDRKVAHCARARYTNKHSSWIG